MKQMVESASLGSEAFFQYLGAATQLFASTLFYIIVTRLFTSSEVGAIALFVAIIGIMTILFRLGLGNAAQHFISFYLGRNEKDSARTVIVKISSYGILSAFAGALVMFIFSKPLSIVLFHDSNYTYLINLLGIVLSGNILWGILGGLILGLQKFKISGILNVIVWPVYYFGPILIAFFDRTLFIIVIGWIIGILIGLVFEGVVLIREIRIMGGQDRGKGSVEIFSYSIPLLASVMISYGASYIDRFVVAGLMTLSDLGIYNLSILIATSVNFIVDPFNRILLPKFSELYGKGRKDVIRERFRTSLLLLSYVYTPVSFIIVSLSKPIILFLAGSNYLSAEVPLDIIVLFMAFFSLQSIAVQAISSIRRNSIFLLSSSASLSVNLILSIFLIPKIGFLGAAIGFLSVYGVSFLIVFYFAYRHSLASLNVGGLCKIWVASLVVYITIHIELIVIADTIYLLPAYAVSAAFIYIFLTKRMRVFSQVEVDLISRIFSSQMSIFNRMMNKIIRIIT